MKFSYYRRLILTAMILLILNAKAEGMWIHLDESQKGQAISYGIRNVQTDLRAFYKEWTVDLGADGVAILNTEFLTLAFAARDAAISGQEMDNFSIEDSLAKAQGKLVFSVTLFGKGADFAKDYTGLLRVGGKIYPATYWEEGEVNSSESQPGLFVQDLFYYFPLGEIPLEGQVALLVGNPAKKEKTEFNFDLKKMR